MDGMSRAPLLDGQPSDQRGSIHLFSGGFDYWFMNESRLFVGNLSYQTKDNELQDYFAAAGVLTSVHMVQDKLTGRSRGFAFLDYATLAEATKAVELFHQKEFQGRPLTVNIARPREERPSEGGAASLQRSEDVR